MESRNISDWLITLGLWETVTLVADHRTLKWSVDRGDYYLKYPAFYAKVRI